MDALDTENTRELQPQVAVHAEDPGIKTAPPCDAEHRELTLMFTDIVGYSRLMGHDETLAVAMLNDYREILLAHIAEHGGVFIEFAGDAVLARFDTAASAVAAAVAIQKHLQLFNLGRAGELPRLQTRIGLHKGQILLRDNAVFGDDVNIAARLETLAVADGICISKAVYDEVRLPLLEPVKPLGLQPLKNIGHKVRAYLIKPTGLRWRDHLHYFLLRRQQNLIAYRYPIAAAIVLLVAGGFYYIPRWLVPGYTANYVEVASFQNLMNADGKADYFSSGITEAVRSQLADLRDVYIVDSGKGILAPIRLEGSVQKLGNNLRIAYRIFRRKGNVQIAGGKLDGAYQDIFVLQDRLVGDIARSLAREFKLQNFRPAPLKLTRDITAYDYYLQGLESLAKPTAQENIDAAIQRFTEALIHDGQFAQANSGLCEAYRRKFDSTKAAAWLSQAESHCREALRQDGNSLRASSAIGALYRDTGRYPEALRYLQSATEKAPDDARAAIELADTYDLMKDDRRAETIYVETINKSPKNWQGYQGYGYFLFRHGRYDEALENYNKVLALIPDNASALSNKAVAYMYKGEFRQAAETLENATRIDPDSTYFLNAGTNYYFSGDFVNAVRMYREALRLQPDDMEFLVNIADALNFSSGKLSLADDYYRQTREQALSELQMNPDNVPAHQFLALVHAHFGEINMATEQMAIADKLDADDQFSYYVHLRLAVLQQNEVSIQEYLHRLLKSGYSSKLIFADPYFAALRDRNFQALANR